MTWVRWVVRQLRADPWPPVLLAVSVAVLVALTTAVPRATADLSARAMTGALSALSAQQGDLMAQWRSGPTGGPVGDPAAVHLEAAEQVRLAQPTPLRDLLRPPQLVAELGFPLSVTPPVDTGYHRLTFALLVDATLEDHAELVAGAWPEAPSGDGAVSEIAVPDTAAERLGWVIGTEPLPGLRLSGTFRALDPADLRWEHNPRGLRYAELDDPNLGTELVGAVYLDPGALAVGVSGRRPQILHRLWFGLDPSAVTAGEVTPSELSRQLTGLLARSHPLGPGPDGAPVDLRLFSELDETLTAVEAQQRTLTSLVWVLASGPLAIGVLLVGLAATAVRTRRAGGTALLRARGQSPDQLALATAAESVVLALAGGILGHAAVAVAYPVSGHGWQWFVTLTLILALATALPAAHFLGHGESSRGARTARGARVRIAAEAVTIGLAVLSVVLLVRGDPGERVDALAAAAPVLLTVATGLLVWRVYPMTLRALAGRLRRGRGLAGLLGVLRALRDPAGGAVALIAVVLGVSMAFMGVGLGTSLEATGRQAAWLLNGAPVRMAGPRVSDDVLERIRRIDGVKSVARIARVADSQALTVDGGERDHLGVWVTEPEVLAVYRGTPTDPGLPAGLFDDRSPSGVVTGGSAPSRTGPGVLDGVGDVWLLGHRRALPGAGTPSAWVLVPAGSWGSDGADLGSATLALVAIDDDAASQSVAERLRQQFGTADVTTVEDRLQGGHVPATRGFQDLVRWGSVLTLGLMAAAVVGADLIASRSRRETLNRLRAIGMAGRDLRAGVAWEVAPALLLALVTGAALGTGLAALLMVTLDFSFITGATAVFAVDPLAAGGIVVLVLASFGFIVRTAGARMTRAAEEDR